MPSISSHNLKFQRSTALSFGLKEIQVASIVWQLLETVKYLHSEKVSICHRDINPNNVMVSEMNEFGDLKVTLIDFNVSKRFRE